MAYKQKYPKGKGFGFKGDETPFKHPHILPWNYFTHNHNTGVFDDDYEGEPGTIPDASDQDWSQYDVCYDGAGSEVSCDSDSVVSGSMYAVSENTDAPLGYDEVDMYMNVGGGTSAEYESTDPNWQISFGGNISEKDPDNPNGGGGTSSGFSGISSSLDGAFEEGSILAQQAAKRREDGAHRWSRGGQEENPDRPEYPWGEDPNVGGGFDPDNPIADEIPDRGEGLNPIDYDPDGDGVANIDDDRGEITIPDSDRPDTTDTFGDEVSSIDDAPSGGRPDVSPIDANINLTTDIFGNVVSPVDDRGRQVPFSTVSTPATFRIGRRNKNTDNNKRRGFIQPRSYNI